MSSESQTYAYDALYRVTNFDVGIMSGGGIPLPSIAESYNLDAVGNWTSFTSNFVTQTRTHNAVNEYQSINAGTLTYDANGNLLDDGNYAYTYDVENRVTTITRDSDSALVGQVPATMPPTVASFRFSTPAALPGRTSFSMMPTGLLKFNTPAAARKTPIRMAVTWMKS